MREYKYFLILLLLIAFSTQAQTKVYTGTVLDEAKFPIPGVNVLEKGTNNGVSTDFDGNFKISTNEKAVLVFSYIGYSNFETQVKGQTKLNIVLKSEATSLNEIVLIGYGSQKKKDVTSAISNIKVKDVSSRPIVNAVEAMTGKAAGVQVASSSGSPGGTISVRIRGMGSPNGGEPLYVVDGVLTSNVKGIDPNNIESINVLKDASAAGIYGAAGSTNGVVLITTKKGKKGKSTTAINYYGGFQQIVRKLPVLNNSQWFDLQKEILGTDPGVPNYYDLAGTNNNWQDLIYRNAAQSSVNVNTSGGSDTGTYYLGIGHLKQEGIIRESNFERYSANLSVNQDVNKSIKMGGSINYDRTNQRSIKDNASANFGGVVLSALVTPEYIPIKMPSNAPIPGVYGVSNYYSGENPISLIYNNTNKTIGNNFLGNAFVEAKLSNNITYRNQINGVVQNSKYDYFLNPSSSLVGRSTQGGGDSTFYEVFRWQWDNTINYKESFGEHSFDVIFGTSAMNESISKSTQHGAGFATSAIETLNAASSDFRIGTSQYDWSTNSYFGRINYGYGDRYLFTATFRRDGSSRVGKNVVNGNFPALSAGWKVSNEKFMEDVKWMQNLKIRAGWGKTGNLPPYTMLYPSYSLLNAGAPYAYNSTDIAPGIKPAAQLGNPDLKWESATQTNLGVEVGFLDNRLNLTVDYYHKKVEDMIFTLQLPMTSGSSIIAMNLPGSDINKGIEFAIDAKIIDKKNFGWNSNFNFSKNDNKIVGLDSNSTFQTGPILVAGSQVPLYTQVIKNGYPLGTFWGYKSEGVDPQTGNLVYSNEMMNLGSALPKYTFGFTNEFTSNGISLSFLIDGVQGNKIYNTPRMEIEALSGYANESVEVLNRWQKPGDITSVPRALGNGTTNTAAATMLQNRVSSNYIEDGSFVRLKNITLSYQIENEFTKRIGLTGFKVFATAQNLVTLHNYKGYYPEVNGDGQGTNNQAQNAGSGSSLMSLGVDKGTYPSSKTFTMGINVQL
ncbi:SusC/RagA family TonB-linked outer membrane protein [Flavobacterium cellulosilyticum]|uniref:TonB-dependent receptor n=1 Tax=Flavobacterium cellulosilyticum TaxID=2541731 RepID=A0A4R5CH70_9FLAO|nr:TonB-dependent receptor [Flavobacterium cellulosilyticum]TDD96632.1 TonB-dependent receptor [Flavobacterium cellulosilyticum]